MTEDCEPDNGGEVAVSFDFDDAETCSRYPVIAIDPQEIARQLLRAQIDWIRLRITSTIEVLLRKGEIDFLLQDLDIARMLLGHRDSGEVFSYWNDGEFSMTCSATGDVVDVDIRHAPHLSGALAQTTRRALTREACLNVWNRMAGQLVEAIDVRLASLPPITRPVVDATTARMVRLELNFDSLIDVSVESRAQDLDTEMVAWSMTEAGVEYVELKLLDDVTVVFSMAEFGAIVDDIEPVRSFLEDATLDAHFCYWARGAVEVSYTAVGELIKLDLDTREGKNLRRFHRSMSRPACLAVWDRLVRDLGDLLEHLESPK